MLKGITDDDILDIITFDQARSDTALGFGGAGGQTVTSVPTIVVLTFNRGYLIYIGSRFAYDVKDPSEMFYKDLEDRWIAGPIDKRRKQYERKEGNGKQQ